MRHATILLTLLLGAGCATGTDMDEVPESQADALDYDHVTPALWFSFASVDSQVLATPTYSDAVQQLAGPSSALADALAAAGWSQSESAAMVTLAAGHNSGAVHDGSRARQLELRDDIAGAFLRFDAELTLAEASEGTSVNRKSLFARFYPPVVQ